MNKSEVMKLLESHKNERGIKNWNEMEYDKCQYDSFGIGLTILRKLSKQIGKDHQLAQSLWNTNYYDAKVVAILIDESKLITKEQIESQVKDINFGMLVHVFSACGAPVAHVPFIIELTDEWLENNDSVKRRCAYGFLYELSKSKKKSAPDESYYMKQIKLIENTFTQEDKTVHMSMAAALMGIGKRTRNLNQTALKVANEIGPVEVDSGKSKCEPFNISKHLTSDYLTKKFGL